MSEASRKPPRGGKVKIQVPAGLEPTYANFAVITNSPSEIVIDFAQILPQMHHARVKARVVMTPMNAKLVHRALTKHLDQFEAQYGEIDVPEVQSLADELFKPPSPPDSEEDE
jgi:hypothetical protein